MIRGILYVRIDDDQVTELLYPEVTTEYGNTLNYFSIIQVRYGSEPSFRSRVFKGDFQKGSKSPSGTFTKFQRPTHEQILELLNSWNDSPIVAGTVREWLNTVKEKCEILVPPDKELLEELAQKSKYWK